MGNVEQFIDELICIGCNFFDMILRHVIEVKKSDPVSGIVTSSLNARLPILRCAPSFLSWRFRNNSWFAESGCLSKDLSCGWFWWLRPYRTFLNESQRSSLVECHAVRSHQFLLLAHFLARTSTVDPLSGSLSHLLCIRVLDLLLFWKNWMRCYGSIQSNIGWLNTHRLDL